MAGLPGFADALVREFELPRLDTLVLRLRVWCNSSRLTRELASGACVVDSRELALRAGQITDARTRSLLAASIEEILHQAAVGRPIFSAQVPVDKAKIVLARVPLLELADRLRSRESVTPCGMARVLLLLTDPARPLYGCSGAVDLAEAVIDARQMLDDAPESRLEL
jgi:hypothetical protein